MHTAIRLAADVHSAAVARRAVERFTEDLDVDPAVASLIATELVTNAVRHGGEPIVLHLRFERASLFVEVSDGDRADSDGGDVGAVRNGEGGLGLVIVEHLSRAWGVRESPRGSKTVWAEIDCVPTSSKRGNGHATRDADEVAVSHARRERDLAALEPLLAVGAMSMMPTADAPLRPEVVAIRDATSTMRENAAAIAVRVAQLREAAAAMHENAAVLQARLAVWYDPRTTRP